MALEFQDTGFEIREDSELRGVECSYRGVFKGFRILVWV